METQTGFATLLQRTGRHLYQDILPTIALLLSLALGMSMVATLIPFPEADASRPESGELAFTGLQLRSLQELP